MVIGIKSASSEKITKTSIFGFSIKSECASNIKVISVEFFFPFPIIEKQGIILLPQSGNLQQSFQILIFLCFVSISGFYVMFRFIDLSINNSIEPCIDMYFLYIVYMFVSSIHTCVFIDIIRDKE